MNKKHMNILQYKRLIYSIITSFVYVGLFYIFNKPRYFDCAFIKCKPHDFIIELNVINRFTDCCLINTLPNHIFMFIGYMIIPFIVSYLLFCITITNKHN